MNKTEFMEEMSRRLTKLPKKEQGEFLRYYSELIDDAMENGQTESSIIESFGSLETITEKALEQSDLEKRPGKFPRWLKIVLFFFCSPVLFALFVSAYAVLFSLSVACVSIFLAGIPFFATSFLLFPLNAASGLFQIGMTLFLIFGAILLSVGLWALWKWSIRQTGRFFRWIGRLFQNGGKKYE